MCRREKEWTNKNCASSTYNVMYNALQLIRTRIPIRKQPPAMWIAFAKVVNSRNEIESATSHGSFGFYGKPNAYRKCITSHRAANVCMFCLRYELSTHRSSMIFLFVLFILLCASSSSSSSPLAHSYILFIHFIWLFVLNKSACVKTEKWCHFFFIKKIYHPLSIVWNLCVNVQKLANLYDLLSPTSRANILNMHIWMY